MLNAAEKNSLRPKQGYRYQNDIKRLAVYQRILAGPMAFKSLQLNLDGCFPSISTTNRYIHRSDHVMIEGQLRVDELLVYLKERDQSLWVVISEDATRVGNRVQYDSRTNQLIGFVLPINGTNGMPIPFFYKARSADEILEHFSNDTMVATFVNTIMAQPLGNAAPFCLLVFGSDSRYTAEDVANRWNFISEELKQVGIGVLASASDSDPKYNAAMRKNSMLGAEPKEIAMKGIFKCGITLKPPFYFQDFPHVGTKLRNLFLKTISVPRKLRFGKYFVQQEHLKQLMNIESKDKHFLTPNDLNPLDK